MDSLKGTSEKIVVNPYSAFFSGRNNHGETRPDAGEPEKNNQAY